MITWLRNLWLKFKKALTQRVIDFFHDVGKFKTAIEDHVDTFKKGSLKQKATIASDYIQLFGAGTVAKLAASRLFNGCSFSIDIHKALRGKLSPKLSFGRKAKKLFYWRDAQLKKGHILPSIAGAEAGAWLSDVAHDIANKYAPNMIP